MYKFLYIEENVFLKVVKLLVKIIVEILSFYIATWEARNTNFQYAIPYIYI